MASMPCSEGEVAQDERPAAVLRQTGLGPRGALDEAGDDVTAVTQTDWQPAFLDDPKGKPGDQPRTMDSGIRGL